MGEQQLVTNPTPDASKSVFKWVRDAEGRFACGTAAGPGNRPGERDPYKFVVEAQCEFLELTAKGRGPTTAARIAGVHPTTPYARARVDPLFAEAWEEAKTIHKEDFEWDMLQHARDGNFPCMKFYATNKWPMEWADQQTLINRMDERLAEERNKAIESSPADSGQTRLVIVEDDNFYGHSTSATEAAGASETRAAGLREIQARCVRETVGQNGVGPASGAPGPRP